MKSNFYFVFLFFCLEFNQNDNINTISIENTISIKQNNNEEYKLNLDEPIRFKRKRNQEMIYKNTYNNVFDSNTHYDGRTLGFSFGLKCKCCVICCVIGIIIVFGGGIISIL